MAEPSQSASNDEGGRVDELESGFLDLARDHVAQDLDHEARALERDAREKLIACASVLLPRKPNVSREDARDLARLRRDIRRRQRYSGWDDEWDPPPPKKCPLEKAWALDSPTAARRWIVSGWLPTIEPVRRTLGVAGVEEFEPTSPVHRVIRTLYLQLFEASDRDETVDEIEAGLRRLRSELGPGDALPWNYFKALAARIGAPHRPKTDVGTAQPTAADEPRLSVAPEDRLVVRPTESGGFSITRTINGVTIDHVTIRQKQLARLFEIVSGSPTHLRWNEVRERWAVASNWKELVDVETLKKYGRRLRQRLTDSGFGKYWRYSSNEVGWLPAQRDDG